MWQDSETNIIVLNTALKYIIPRNTKKTQPYKLDFNSRSLKSNRLVSGLRPTIPKYFIKICSVVFLNNPVNRQTDRKTDRQTDTGENNNRLFSAISNNTFQRVFNG